LQKSWLYDLHNKIKHRERQRLVQIAHTPWYYMPILGTMWEQKRKNEKSDKDNSQKYSLKKRIYKGKKAERGGRK